MKKFYAIVAGYVTYYATDVECDNGYIHIYGGLKTKFTFDEQRASVTVAFSDITYIYTYDRDDFLTVLSTFDFTLDDNDVIVPKTETYVSLKSLDQIALELRDKEGDCLVARLYDRLFGISLEKYEKLRQEFGERKKSECEFNELETFLVFDRYHIVVECLNFEERSI
jgi:hypothetical protein